MKTILLYTSTIFFILGTSFAHEIAVSPVIEKHKTVTEHRISQLDSKIGAICTTSWVTTITDGVESKTRKSVDCEE